MVKKIVIPASKIFKIKDVSKTDKLFSEIPYLNFSFETSTPEEVSFYLNEEDKKGYGIYTITFNDKKNKSALAYIGSFCKGNDVVSERWLPHMGTLTCRSHKTNFKSYKSRSFKNLTLGEILKNKIDYKDDLIKIINDKKTLLKNDMKEIENSLFYIDVLTSIFNINYNCNNQTIRNLLGEGTSTSKERIKFACRNWSIFKNKTKDNLLDCFTFTYYRLPNYLDFDLPLNKIKGRKIKDLILENLTEFHLIEKYKPAANTKKNPKLLEYLLKDEPYELKSSCLLNADKIRSEVAKINKFIENDFNQRYK